jgi:succinate-semialdehyde dehydrogenase/glutarate-semialdehyde dehydrogenase
VVGVISPWNGPFVLSIVPTIQALMAGNAVVLKPSSVTPFSGKLVGDLFQAAGLPEGVMNVILGDSETGQALLESGVNKISFTGSVEVGRHVAEECAKRLIPCTLELGGKDPMIVCADADLNNAAGGAVSGCFVNTGQYCCGTERVYVVEAIADEFIKNVVERVKKLRQGSDGEFDIGTTFWPQQIPVIEAHIADAVSKGARVLLGGQRNLKLKGVYFEPTVIIDVDHSMSIMREETFGPVIPIMRVCDEEEAIRMANDSHFGLSSNVWTKDTAKGLAIGQRIQSGSVNVNDMAITYGVPEAPFGGVKDSGLGRVNGEMGLRSYCNIKPIIIDLFGGAQTANMYPTSLATVKVIQDTIRAMWGNAA